MRSLTKRKLFRVLFWVAFLLLSGSMFVPWAFRARESAGQRNIADILEPQFEKFSGTDWSANHPGEGRQPFEAFVNHCPLEADVATNPICILPLGPMTDSETQMLKKTSEYLGLFYNRPVKMLASNSLSDLPAHARRIHPEWGNEQYLAGYLLTHYVQPAAPENAVATLGFTMTDLWPGRGWNFVFGLARLGSRIGVHSLQKHGNPNGTQSERRAFLLRSLKIAAHETGHMYGIPHCVAYHCDMNGSNGVDDTDRAPLMFCPECLRKIWWANRIEPRAWFQNLESFLRGEGLDAEADQCAELADVLADV